MNHVLQNEQNFQSNKGNIVYSRKKDSHPEQILKSLYISIRIGNQNQH